METIYEALKELKKQRMNESVSALDDIDAKKDDKIEKAKLRFKKRRDDLDADRDEKLKAAKRRLARVRDDADADRDDKLEESYPEILSTDEFVDWHDHKILRDPRRRAKLDLIYQIFENAGFDSEEDVDICYENLSDADKRKVTDIIGWRIDESKESAAQELKDDQEWIDYDMDHDHHISKATQKDIEDQGLEIEKDQYGDYEVAAKDENLEESNGIEKLKKLIKK